MQWGGIMNCKDCGSNNIHIMAWVDKNNKYVGDTAYSENGEYWCVECQDHKEGYDNEK